MSAATEKKERNPFQVVQDWEERKSREGGKTHGRSRAAPGQRAADWTTKNVGSWKFVSLLFGGMAAWMLLNVVLIESHKWDPYPFMLLTFVVSFLAAALAPIILMSQNRQADRDRIRAECDYAINRKAEKEIQELRAEMAEMRGMIQDLHRKR
jgi:uncharacterized membrane protein